MKYLFILIAGLAGIAAFVLTAGYLVPREYEGSAIIEVRAAPEAIWAVLEAPEAYPSWRSGVASVELAQARPGSWREVDSGGSISDHEALPGRPNEKFIERFAAVGASGDRGERVVLMVMDAKGNTRVSITEKGVIDGPLARFRARFATGYRVGPRKLGEDLRKRLGE